jgi:acetyl-CoA carboxylase biotin carboxyl carrier protein
MIQPVVAPITGVVWKILVSEGDMVLADEPLVLLESMKMEVPVLAPLSGRVIDITVTLGLPVEDGQVLVSLQY